jgi:amino acid transporter, AAT family
VSTILTSLLAENRPWSLAGRPAPVAVAVAALIGNAVLGTLIYFVVLPIAKLLICWAFWMIAWANIFDNKPTRFGLGLNVAVRVAVTFVLACVTYLLYYFVLAQHVLHEPVAAGTLFGDALGFIDWAILWMLWYVLFLGSYGLPEAPKADVEAGTADPESREAGA